MKCQFSSNEPLVLTFPSFFDKDNTAFVTTGFDTVQFLVKAPDNSSFVLFPTFISNVKVWKSTVSVGAFQEGLWFIKASSSAPNTFDQYRALVWGDYVDDISETRQMALGRWKIDGTQLTIYEDDGTTPFKVFNLLDKFGQPSITEIFERDPV